MKITRSTTRAMTAMTVTIFEGENDDRQFGLDGADYKTLITVTIY